MYRLVISLVISLLLVCPAWAFGQAQATQPNAESTSRPTQDQPPSPPDAPIPDQGSQTSPPAASRTRRVVNKLDPHCIDVIFHTCWSAPAGTPEKPISEEQRALSSDLEVGYYYLREKNYRAAESRLNEAVAINPTSTGALLGLAQAEQKLGKDDDARKHYQKYLELNSSGQEADKVRKALAQLR